MNHIDGVTSHAQDRALQYLGYEPSEDVWTAAVTEIVTRRAVCMHKDPHGTERWTVQFDGQPLLVIWSPEHARIVTLPPPGSVASKHFARKLPRGGLGRAPFSEDNAIRLRGKSIKLNKVWR